MASKENGQTPSGRDSKSTAARHAAVCLLRPGYQRSSIPSLRKQRTMIFPPQIPPWSEISGLSEQRSTVRPAIKYSPSGRSEKSREARNNFVLWVNVPNQDVIARSEATWQSPLIQCIRAIDTGDSHVGSYGSLLGMTYMKNTTLPGGVSVYTPYSSFSISSSLSISSLSRSNPAAVVGT